MRLKQVTIYHGWWPKSFVNGSWQSVTGLYINPVQETDDMVHKQVSGQMLEEGYSPQNWAPTGVNRDCAVAVVKVGSLEEALALGKKLGICDLTQNYIGNGRPVRSVNDLPDVWVQSNLRWKAPKWMAKDFAASDTMKKFISGRIQPENT
jgi:hypothetical protein